MHSFFVLGQVPGTDLIISFWMWVELAALLAVLMVWVAYRRHLDVINYVTPTISDESSSLKAATAR